MSSAKKRVNPWVPLQQPLKPPRVLPIPPRPTDPEFGLAERLYRARLANDTDEVRACVLKAMEIATSQREAVQFLGLTDIVLLSLMCAKLGLNYRKQRGAEGQFVSSLHRGLPRKRSPSRRKREVC